MPDCKILVIDDDDDIRESIVALLNSEGMEAAGARSGIAALSMMTWARFVPDVILLDLIMPSMSGEQFRGMLQKNASWSSIPIVICSGEAISPSLRPHVFGVLEKPFDLDKLFSLIKSACASRGRARAKPTS